MDESASAVESPAESGAATAAADRKFGRRIKLTKESRVKMALAKYKTGQRAKLVTKEQVLEHRLRQVVHPKAPEIIRMYHTAISEGLPSATDPISIISMAEMEILRQCLVGSIAKEGVLLREESTNKDGVTTERTKAHPGFEHLRWVYEHLGATARDLRISRRGQDASAKDKAVTRELERRTRLQEFVAAGRRLPSPPIDTEIVE